MVHKHGSLSLTTPKGYTRSTGYFSSRIFFLVHFFIWNHVSPLIANFFEVEINWIVTNGAQMFS